MSTINPIHDNQLDAVTGGANFSVQSWTQYVNSSITPIINPLYSQATGYDYTIVDSINNTIRSTLVRGADVAQPIKDMYSDYNRSMRDQIISTDVKTSLDTVVSNAYNYIITH